MPTTTVPHSDTDFDAVLTPNLHRAAAATLPLANGALQRLGITARTETHPAAAEAVFPGNTPLTDDKPTALAVYPVTRNRLSLSAYAAREAARAKGEACLKRCPLPEGALIGPVPDNGDETVPEDLVTFGSGRNDEYATSPRITVQPVLVAHDSESED
ncbi:hypothetical protein ACIP93_32725 [Streptomyces sp. NPDC088745]|uniref:hypothetical protein n=1 Tax=Streptomyces sp. NPDC088745 TaxID=3365884 RepID=UPI00381AD280